MIDRALRIAFAITGSRTVSELISERRVEAKWQAMKAAHLAAGGTVVAKQGPNGTESTLI